MSVTPDDLIDQVRKLLPSVLDESTLRDAAECLAGQYNMTTSYADPYFDQERMSMRHRVAVAPYRLLESMENPNTPDGTFDPKVFAGRRGGGVVDADIWSAIPDAATAGQHTVVKGRNKKGTTAVVTHRGVPTVIGAFDRDVHGNPIMATPEVDDVGNASWCAARMLTTSEAMHRTRGGWSGIGVQRVTDMAFALDDDVKMIGTDAEAWKEAQISRADRAVRWTLSGMSFGSIVAQSAEYMSHTSITWPSRYTLNRGRRRAGDPIAVKRTVLKRNTRTVAPTWLPSHTVESLPAPADDAAYMYVGHQLVKRADVKVKRGGRKARTIMAVAASTTPNTAGGWQALAESLNTGDRITAADGLVSICRTNDRYTSTDKRGDTPVRFTVRTSTAVGIRLAS